MLARFASYLIPFFDFSRIGEICGLKRKANRQFKKVLLASFNEYMVSADGSFDQKDIHVIS